MSLVQTENDLINSLFLPYDGEEDSSTFINSTFIDGDTDLYFNSRKREGRSTQMTLILC